MYGFACCLPRHVPCRRARVHELRRRRVGASAAAGLPCAPRALLRSPRAAGADLNVVGTQQLFLRQARSRPRTEAMSARFTETLGRDTEAAAGVMAGRGLRESVHRDPTSQSFVALLGPADPERQRVLPGSPTACPRCGACAWRRFAPAVRRDLPAASAGLPATGGPALCTLRPFPGTVPAPRPLLPDPRDPRGVSPALPVLLATQLVALARGANSIAAWPPTHTTTGSGSGCGCLWAGPPVPGHLPAT